MWHRISESNYEINEKGEVRHVFKKTILKQQTSNSGYMMVEIKRGAKTKKYYVHRLLWEAFNGSIPEGMVINHINEIKTDNRLENLNIVTQKENINWGGSLKKRALAQAKPILQLDLNNNVINEFESINEAGRYIDKTFSKKGSASSIGWCLVNPEKHKTAYKYKWMYKK